MGKQTDPLRQLRNDWDEQGSEAPTEAAVTRLDAFIAALAQGGRGLAVEQVAPDPMGGAGADVVDPDDSSRSCYVLFANSGKTHIARGDDARSFAGGTSAQDVERVLVMLTR